MIAETVVLCEGFHDRAFLSGWLKVLGAESLREGVYEPHGARLRGRGQYGFRLAERWFRIVPMDGDSAWQAVASAMLGTRTTRAIERMVVVLDDDSVGTTGGRQQSFEHWVSELGAIRATPHTFRLSGGIVETEVALAVWSAQESLRSSLPDQQTLERLVCAALAEVDASRAEHVRAFLAARPSPPSDEKLHKSHAAAHMAGWFSSHGSEDFFRAVWDEPALRRVLERRLAELGATEAFGL